MLKLRLDNQCDTPRHKSEQKYNFSLTKPPSEYFKSFYVDTTTMSSEAILNTLNVLGEDHVLLGTDFPPGSISPKQYLHLIDGLPVSKEIKSGIKGKNAEKLLRI